MYCIEVSVDNKKYIYDLMDGSYVQSENVNKSEDCGQTNQLIIPHDSFHESQIWIPAIRGNRTTYTHISSTFQVAALFL